MKTEQITSNTIAGKIKAVIITIPQDIGSDRSKSILPVIPNMGIVSLLKWMEMHGYHGEFLDIDMLQLTSDEIFNFFDSKKPAVVGISAVVSTSYLQVKQIAKVIREACPSIKIVLGGNMAVSAGVLLQKTEVDVCVIGEGEQPWLDILNSMSENFGSLSISQLTSIKGVAFLNEKKELEFTGYPLSVSFEEGQFPDYGMLASGLLEKPEMVENYFRNGRGCFWFNHDERSFEAGRKDKIAHVPASKGCVARCTFCQRFIKGYHKIDLERLDLHLAELKEKHNVGFIIISGENFGAPREYGFEVARILKKHNMLWFAGGVRSNTFSKVEDFAFLKECGCTGIKFGVESGSQKILDIMEKRFKIEDVYNAISLATECGIMAPLSFCIGMPGETDETVMETGRFISRVAAMKGALPDKVMADIFYALPLPGAPLYEYGILQTVFGASLDDEEQFLMYISDKGSRLENYINLSGASKKKLIFWDRLFRLEAKYEYYNSYYKKEGEESRIISKQMEQNFFEQTKEEKPKRNLSWILAKISKPASSLGNLMARGQTIAVVGRFIPRRMIYFLLRELNYIEYKIYRLFASDNSDSMRYRINRKRLSNDIRTMLNSGTSLRKINARLRDMDKSPKSITEKNMEILLQGR